MKKEMTLAERRKALKQREFLKRFQRTGNLTDGAMAAGVSRQTVYYWKKTSPLFASQMMQALDHFERTGDGYKIAAICTLAQAGDRDMQGYILRHHGSSALKKVMRGIMLTGKTRHE